MKIQIKLIAVVLFTLAFFSCKKKYDTEFLGPQGKEEINFQLTGNLKTNTNGTDTVNFTSSHPFFFSAKFDKSITWKLTIVGDSSGATKTFIGTSVQIDSLTSRWYGEQDSLYYFNKETCTVTLTDYYPTPNNLVYNSISKNSDIISPTYKLSSTISINIRAPKPIPSLNFPLFEIKRPGFNTGYGSGAQYDPESSTGPCDGYMNSEADPSIGSNKSQFLFNDYLPFSKNGKPINRRGLTRKVVGGIVTYPSYYSNNYFMLKGTDSFNNDYYIGRLERTIDAVTMDSLRKYLTNYPVSEDNVWFNVFVYGVGDGAQLNYTIKEDDDYDSKFNQGRFKPCGADKAYLDHIKDTLAKTMDDAYQYPIKLDFIGWKLFSIKYKDFSLVPRDGINSNGKGERNPNKLLSVQFSLVAPDKGKSGQAIFDYPVMTIGGPLKY